jgi:spore coat polysaccharide biosynthesis predicted glycosyltransferase SpsG
MAVVFRVAAGPRLGFGHLARCRAVAAALRIRPQLSVRGTATTRRTAAGLGAILVAGGPRTVARRAIGALVVDDPHPASARPWITAARRAGVPVVLITDAGRHAFMADLVVDGTVRAPRRGRGRRLTGPRFAIVDARIARLRTARRVVRGRVLVALGGGRHVRRHVAALVSALATALPGADICVAPGFSSGPLPRLPQGRWIAPGAMAPTLAQTEVAVISGGVSAYEACALGVAAVAVAVVPAQRPTLRALARLGALTDAGLLRRDAIGRIAARASALASAPARRREMARAGRRLVDGHGTYRIARAIARLGETAEGRRA